MSPVAVADPVTTYADEVASGERLAGRLVRLAAERHLRDLERDDLAWDPEAAERALRFFPAMLKVRGGAPFHLSPHQAFIVGSLYGWRSAADPSELRFTVAYIEVAKGDGKTPLAAGLGLKALCFEGVPEAEIYCAATKKDQAMILFRDAVGMAQSSPKIDQRLKTSGRFPAVWNLAHVPTRSFYRPIATEEGQSGPRVYRGLLDEIHEHRNSTALDLMVSGTKGMKNALIVMITNSGWDRQSVCWREHDYTAQVLEGSLEDDSRFGFIAGLDPCAAHLAEGKRFPVEGCEACDDWRDEAVWEKATPNLGVTVQRDYLRRLVRQAEGMPSKQGIVKRLNFCIWTEQQDTWLPVEEWSACAQPALVSAEALAGRRCFAGLDMAYSDDISALVLYFPPEEEGEPGQVLAYFWVPRQKVWERVEQDRVPYDRWVEDGLIEATEGHEGKVTDYAFIRQRVVDLYHEFEIQSIPFDPTNAIQLATELHEQDLPVILFPQGCKKFSPAMKEMERLIKARAIAHDGNPVLTWMMGNVAPFENSAGERKPDKKRSREKIDGVVALLMAVAMATETAEEAQPSLEVV